MACSSAPVAWTTARRLGSRDRATAYRNKSASAPSPPSPWSKRSSRQRRWGSRADSPAPQPYRPSHSQRTWPTALQSLGRRLAVPPAQQAVRAHRHRHHRQAQLPCMCRRHRQQDDDRARGLPTLHCHILRPARTAPAPGNSLAQQAQQRGIQKRILTLPQGGQAGCASYPSWCRRIRSISSAQRCSAKPTAGEYRDRL